MEHRMARVQRQALGLGGRLRTAASQRHQVTNRVADIPLRLQPINELMKSHVHQGMTRQVAMDPWVLLEEPSSLGWDLMLSRSRKFTVWSTYLGA